MKARRTRAYLFAAGWIFASIASAQSEGPRFPSSQRTSPALSVERVQKPANAPVPGDYRIGAEDLLEITIFDAPEMNRQARVSATGEISMPLIGPVRAAGLTPRELELVLGELLRRRYLKDPQVGVVVREMQSHAVSVVGAVEKPGVYQIRGSKSLVEILALAEGLSADAGDTILLTRQSDGEAGSPQTTEIDIKQLLETGDASLTVLVQPGDVVRVTRAGVVYVIGEVRKPGGFTLRSNEKMTILQALALAEGLERTAAKSRARVIRTDPVSGQRTERTLDLGRVLAGKAEDVRLEPNDILFVPSSAARNALYRGVDAALSIVSGVIIFRR